MNFEPEPIEKVISRLPAAFMESYRLSDLSAGTTRPPALKRQHVFDFQNGVRMTASLEDLGTRRRIHLNFTLPLVTTPPAKVENFVETVRTLATGLMKSLGRSDTVSEQVVNDKSVNFYFFA